MKKLVYALFFILICSQPIFAMKIEGGVSYTVDSARDYLQQGQENSAQPSGHFKFEADSAQKVVYSYNNNNQVIGITVQYINEPKSAYIYNKNGTLIYFEKYDRPVDVYPHRGYRYDMNGNLNLSSLTVSKNEMFRFSPEGKLIAHSINGVIYDESGNIIGHGK